MINVKTMLHWLVLFCVALGTASASLCPSDATGLHSFAALYQSTDTSTDVIISGDTLLDVTNLEVNTIVISGDGKLIFKPGSDITIRTRSIRIKDNGELIIGSEDCRFVDKVDIAIYGSRTVDRSLLTHTGEKSVTAEDNASIKIYGRDKLSWTKMSGTFLPAPEYRHQTESAVNSKFFGSEGLAMTIFDSSLTRVSYAVYDFWKGDAAKEKKQIDKMVNALDAVTDDQVIASRGPFYQRSYDERGPITDGQVVAIALQNFLKYSSSLQSNMDDLYAKIESVAGMDDNTLELRTSGQYDAFAVVFLKGTTSKHDQAVDKYVGKDRMFARASFEAYEKKISATSTIKVDFKKDSLIDVHINSVDYGYPELKLVHNVSDTWQIGDKIVVASTDYAWWHAEEATIKAFPSANSVQLEHELVYRHFGEIEHGVDMRAEVAMLTRNIKIHGEMTPGDCPAVNENCKNFKYDAYGCHVKIIHGFSAVHIEGVEIFNCGQPSDKGSYPLHFHMCGDVTDKEAVLKRNSVHDSYQRAYVVHGTLGTNSTHLGVKIEENVAHRILGHAYFLEDGLERATSFVGNLASSVLKVNNGFFSSDADKPTAYWITTPEVIFKDNVAAGGEGLGIWYIIPSLPVGPSAELNTQLGVYEVDEAYHTPIYTHDNNIAHSNIRDGLNFDNRLSNEHGDFLPKLKYNPRVDPRNESSAVSQVFIYRLTAYKNARINIWTRGGSLVIQQASLAESLKGLQLAIGGPEHQYISKCVIMGESEGNNEYNDYPDAYGKSSNGLASFGHYIGYSVYDGPVWASDIFFVGFKPKPDKSILAAAIGFNPTNEFNSSPVNPVKNVRFGANDPAEMNWVFDGTMADAANGFGNEDGDEAGTVRDEDGSVIKCDGVASTPPYQIYKPEKFVITERSIYRANWKMAYSTDLYGKIFVDPQLPKEFNDTYSQMKRINRLDSTDEAYEDCKGLNNKEYMAVLNRTDKYLYQVQYPDAFPTQIKIDGRGVEKGQNVMVGVCLPEGITEAQMTVKLKRPGATPVTISGTAITWATDLNTLAQDMTMSTVFQEGRFVYVHLVNELVTRDWTWDKFDDDHCPGTFCPSMTIIVDPEASYTYSPCFNPTAEELATDFVIPETVEDCTMSAGTKEDGWGAGDTFASKNGVWRDWGSWAECCNNDPANPVQTSRIRTCNYPTPYGPDGQDCEGAADQTTDCPNDCPST